MKFETNKMYKNVYKDQNTAFHVDEIIEQKVGKDILLDVTWYQLTSDGRYVTVGVSGEFAIPQESKWYYLEV